MLAVAVCAISLALASAAQAATVTVGNPVDYPWVDDVFGGPLTVVTTKAVDTGAPATSPVDGTVVSWSVNDAIGSYSIQILRGVPQHQFTDVAGSAAVPLNNPGVLNAPDQATSLPIQKGDFVGLVIPDNGQLGAPPAPAGEHDGMFEAMTPGQTLPVDSPANPYAYSYRATVRYCVVPSVVGMKLGAARAALAAADCSVGAIRPGKRKRKRRPRVKSQSAAPGASISDAAPIDLRVAKKHRRKH